MHKLKVHIIEFSAYVSEILDRRNSKLPLDAKRMQKIASEDYGILRSVNCVNPTSRNEESVASLKSYTFTLVHFVSQKPIALFSRQSPFFVLPEVLGRWWDQKEHLDLKKKKCRWSSRWTYNKQKKLNLLALKNVVPNRRSSKVDVKVSEASLDGHKNILLYLWVHHSFQHVGSFSLHELQMSWPCPVRPVKLPHLRKQKIFNFSC